MCPTYYSDAEVLDKVFGRRPPGYLEELGKALDPEVEVFWTGSEVCSKNYPADHLAQVTARLGRRPVVWDNYPVNDGPRMCRRLHLGAPDRPGTLREDVAGIFLNPMNQSYLQVSYPRRLLLMMSEFVKNAYSPWPPPLGRSLEMPMTNKTRRRLPRTMRQPLETQRAWRCPQVRGTVML